jgi:hypothetical protein
MQGSEQWKLSATADVADADKGGTATALLTLLPIAVTSLLFEAADIAFAVLVPLSALTESVENKPARAPLLSPGDVA